MKPKNTLRSFLLLAGSSLLAISSASATTLYWDVNGTTADFSTVVQTWNTTNNFWNTDATGGAGGSVTNTTTDADDLIIAQALINTGSITVSGAQNASSITFAPNVGPTANITGGAITIGGTGASSGIFQQSSGANTISTALTLNAAITAFNFSNSSTGLLSIANVTGGASANQTVTVGSSSSGNINLTGAINNGSGGTVALNINSAGAGVTTLNNNNGFTGGLTLTAGTLRATQAGALGAGTLTLNGGILDLSNASSTNFARNTTVGADATILSNRSVGNLGGALTHTLGTLGIGTNTLTVQGGETVTSGTARINFGATTFSGDTIFNVLPQNASSNTLLTLGNLSDGGSGRTITKNGSGNLTWGTITLGGNHTWAVNGGALATLTSGAITGGVHNLTKTGDGLLILSAANTGSGTYTLEGGVTRLGNATSLPGGINATGGTSALTLNGGVLELGNGNFLRNLGAGASQFQITGGESGFSAQGGGRTVTVNNSALTVVQWGTTEFNPSTFVLNAITANNQITFSNRLDLNAATRNIAVMANTATMSGIIETTSGTAGLTKSGAGTLVLSNSSNSYNGATTISEGILQANSSGALGNASNTLVFNGGTLRAGGGITSLATRAVTMTSTGVIDTNNNTVSIAGNIGGAGGLTKTGGNTANFTGVLTLSGTNNYGGVTTVSGGALQFVNEASLYNGTTLSWTAANINVKNGAGLALNVGGTNQFTVANLNTLLTNISVATTADQGLQAGATLILDTTNASGGTFTPSSALADSTGTFGGMINLVKRGAGTLILGQTPTYTGTTTISGGTIQYEDGITPSILTFSNNGALAVNTASGTLTQGSTFHSALSGAGSLENKGGATIVLNAPNYHTGSTTATAGNITLSDALALQFSALNTTGAGTVTLSGVTTPTFGGLSNSGTTRNLADVITTGYGGVTSLTLNPQSGTVTYGGVIADGAAGMTLTKTGAGTQTLQGTNTYTGATTVSAGTLTLSGANGSIADSSSITLNGGRLFLDNGTNNTNRIAGNVNLSLGGELSLSGNGAGTTESVGQLGLGAGYSIITVRAATLASTLDATSFSRTNTGTGLIRGTSLGQNITAMGKVTLGSITGLDFSAGATLDNAASGDTTKDVKIVPWLIGGSADNDAGSTFVTYDTTLGFRALNTTNQFNSTVTAGTNVRLAAATTGIATTSVNSLVIAHTGSSTITDGNALTVSSGAVLFSAAGTIAPAGTTGTLNFGSNPAYITAVANGTISAKISGSAGLVKSGTGTLTLSSVNNDYTGGTTINSGTLAITSDANLGATSGDLTFAGNSTLNMNASVFVMDAGRTITINPGVTATLTSNNSGKTFNGSLEGSGTLFVNHSTSFTFLNASSFTGAIRANTANSSGYGLDMYTLRDEAGDGTITLENGSFRWFGSGGTKTFDDRQFFLGSSSGGSIYNLSTDNSALVITRDLGQSGTGTRTLTLGGNASASGTFAGDIGNNDASAVSVTKVQGGTWILSGTNTHSGVTGFGGSQNGGTLIFSGAASASPNSIFRLSEGSTLALRDDTAGTVTFGAPMQVDLSSQQTSGSANSNIDVNQISTGSGSTLAIGKLNFAGITDNRASAATVNVTGGNGYNLQIASIDLDWGISGSQKLNPTTASAIVTGTVQHINGRPVTGTSVQGAAVGTGAMTFVLDGTSTGNLISGAIKNAADFDDLSNVNALPLNLTKSGVSTWTLSGTNTYTGTTAISAGTLLVNSPGSLNAASAVSVTGTATLGGTGTIGGNVTVAATANVSPGASAGTLSIGGNLDISAPAGGTGKLNFELGANNALSSDRIAVTGTLAIGSGTLGLSDFNLSNLGGLEEGVYILITSGGITGTLNGADLSGDIDGTDITLGTSGNNIILTVGTPSGTPYELWAGPGVLFDADANGDGVSNGMAFLLGASGPTVSALDKLPTVSQSGGGLVLNFNCLPTTARGGAQLRVAHSTNLASWTTTTNVVPDSNVPDGFVSYAVTPGSPLNNVTATIGSAAAAGGGKLFGRLVATE